MDIAQQKIVARDTGHSMLTMVETCFKDCVNDFTSSTLSGKEETCIKRCTEKFVKLTYRVNFATFNYMKNQQPPEES
ncbi:hypothetical protein HDV05_001854 [Chytridiales sp. JEL 0842]|nr:hypothetical protein HDV05_001854 [Chytridiales sp. JEL 0842]